LTRGLCWSLLREFQPSAGNADDSAIVNAQNMTSAPASRRWRIELSDRADLVFSLRDYFRRLGLVAEVESPTLVELRTEKPPSEIEEYVAEWARVNGAPLHAGQVRQELLLLPPPPGMGPPRLGELLISKGYITEEQLAGALTESRATSDLLGVVLLREQLIFEDELARTLSEQLDIPYISVMRVGFNMHVAQMIPSAVGKAAAAIPVREIGDKVQVAFADPTDPQALEAVDRYLHKIEIAVAVAELSDIRLAWRSVKDA
jgi:hypothetical protein